MARLLGWIHILAFLTRVVNKDIALPCYSVTVRRLGALLDYLL